MISPITKRKSASYKLVRRPISKMLPSSELKIQTESRATVPLIGDLDVTSVGPTWLQGRWYSVDLSQVSVKYCWPDSATKCED
jgi:hypothetical protein